MTIPSERNTKGRIVETRRTNPLKYVLFVCGHNAGRSQMSQAFFNAEKGNFPSVAASYEAISVGTRPGTGINPAVAAAMGEVGIDMSDTSVYFPKGMDSEHITTRVNNIGRVIVACDDTCMLPPRVQAIPEHWNLPDPHRQPIERVREIRELTREKVLGLLQEVDDALRLKQ